MSSHTYINDEWIGGVRFDVGDDGAIYVTDRATEESITLALGAENLDALIAAAQAAKAMQAATPEPMDGAQ